MPKLVIAKILIVIGNIFLWFPIIAPLFFSIVTLFIRRRFFFDFLMPAELFPVVIIGSLFLFIATLLLKLKRKKFGFYLLAIILFLILGQITALVTGIANGDTEPAGWRFYLVITLLAGYCFTIILNGFSGLKLFYRVHKLKNNIVVH
jgi:hypothetical protein